MEIVNIRIDDRLIHGQVVTSWSMLTKATRIMVIDDKVVKDVINKEALKMACPKQCKLSILTVKKAAENLISKKYENERIFIIVKNPKTICDLYDAGFSINKVTVGNMGGSKDNKMIKKSVSVTEEDIKNFLYLDNKNVKIVAQMVPSEEEVEFIDLIKFIK